MKKILCKAVAVCLAIGLTFSQTGTAIVLAKTVTQEEKMEKMPEIPENILDGVEKKFYENAFEDGELSYLCPAQSLSSYEEAVGWLGMYIRQFCLLREDGVKHFAVSVPITFYSEEEIDEITKTRGRSMGYDVHDSVYHETGNPDEGELLAGEVPVSATFLNQYTYEDNMYSGNFVFRAENKRTKEEYSNFKKKAAEVLYSLQLDGKSDVEKISAIHKWMSDNVGYNENVSYQHSAYSALMEGGCTCEGKARLFLYFSNSLGIPAYMASGSLLSSDKVAELVDGGYYDEETGTFDSSQLVSNHAWNLVKVNGMYYHVDAGGALLFGLQGDRTSTTYKDKKYPTYTSGYTKEDIPSYLISKNDYNLSNLSCTHENTEVRDQKKATCAKEGYTGNTYCLDCGNIVVSGTVIPKKDHTFDEGVVTKAATCTEDGTRTFTCTVCGETKEETITATGHQNTEIRNQKDASCEEAGYTGDTVCTDCDTVIKQGESIPATGHQDTEVRGAKEATCEADGYTGNTYCKDCGKKIASGETIPSKGHTYGEGVVTTEPTCTKTGVRTYTCSVCKKTKTEEIPALEHSYDEGVVTKEATCTEEGEKTFTCSRCQNTYTAPVEIDPDNHTWGEHISYIWDGDTCTAERACVNNPEHKDKIDLHVEAESEDATCTTPGTIIYTATGTFSDGTKASDTKTVTGEALGHDYKPVVTPPTCQTDGYTTYTCSRCGDTYTSDRVEALPHAYDEPTFIINEEKALFKCSACGYARKVDADIRTEVKKEATCAEEGILSYTASVVFEGKTYSEEGEQAIAKLSHKPDVVKGYAPTCTEDGRTDGVKCSVCGEILSKQEVIPATGHQNTEIRNAKTATCAKEGYTGDTYCKDCGEKISSGTVIAKTAHTWDTGKVTKSATTDAEGVKTYTCTACGSTRTESIPKLPKPDVKVQRISISALSNKIAVKKKMKLSAETFPANAADKRITWTSSNPKVATVNQSGVVTVKKKGSAVITATAASGVKASYKIKGMKGVVKKVAVSGVKPIKAGKALKLKAKVTATKGANTKLTWSSSNENYAKVSASGKVKTTAAGKGKKVKITAMATDGSNKKKTVTIKIK